jgi:hypothetical protein
VDFAHRTELTTSYGAQQSSLSLLTLGGNRSSIRNVVFSSRYLEFRAMDKVQKPSDSGYLFACRFIRNTLSDIKESLYTAFVHKVQRLIYYLGLGKCWAIPGKDVLNTGHFTTHPCYC